MQGIYCGGPGSLALVSLLLCLLAVTRADMDPAMLRTYFGCAPCDPSSCPQPQGCVELVKEPGICGCCLTCAQGEGDACGIFTERCGKGMQCQPLTAPGDDESEPLRTMFRGKGICVRRRPGERGAFGLGRLASRRSLLDKRW